ncbi:uncharacterized protein LOC107273118 [Cephus cinctus]|uniref:Uncharacterized protein LOC107273118 n=1 Tax=Cephus cinctus TaxID=211228 RepID=A0AAJ7RSA1_CEPCN|nr:uncharacterized protein LOC107273118 [Cephus cinctus]
MLGQIILTLSLIAMSCHMLILEPQSIAAANLESMTNFIKDLKRDYLDVKEHRQITVLARNINLLRTVNPLYRDHPIYTGRHANITRSLQYSKIGYVFIFVDNLKDDYLNVCFQDLPNTYKAKVILVVFGSLTVDEIRKMYEMAYTRKTVNILVIHFHESVAQLYRPQVEYKTCTYGANVVGNWSVETGLRMEKKVFDKMMNYQTCPVRIVTLNLEPVMRITEGNNETLRIVGGLEGKLILTFADYMNFTPIVKYPQNKNVPMWKTSSEESDLIDELIMGKADIGVGQLRPSNSDRLRLDFSFTYNYECLTWTVPLIIDWNKNLLFSEFSTISWILIILIIILSAVQQYFSCLMHWNIGPNYSCFFFLFQSFSITVGNPVPISLQKRAEKLQYTLYLIYALIITVAYKTSLAQQLTLRLDPFYRS